MGLPLWLAHGYPVGARAGPAQRESETPAGQQWVPLRRHSGNLMLAAVFRLDQK